ncbi:hypothetical protein AB4K20DRAFT_1982890 [Rhizopus microsporus]
MSTPSASGVHIKNSTFYTFIDDVKKISQFLPVYQKHIKILKDGGFTIIGYIRKFPGSEAKETRNNLLRTMSSKLKERSLVDAVFASPCCHLLSFIIGKEKVCLDTLDFVGLSTDCSDLEPFLKKYQQIKKKIMVDLLPYTNKIHEYDCSQLLREPERLKAFDCRSQPYKRSK